jgi:hypothetical protein
MGWYANQKARRAAAKAGLPSSLPTGLGDKVEAEPAETAQRARERDDGTNARTIAEAEQDAVRSAKNARKRERKLARRGTAGPA